MMKLPSYSGVMEMDSQKTAKIALLQQMIDAVPPDGSAASEFASLDVRPVKKSPQTGDDSELEMKKSYSTEEEVYRRIVELCGYHEFCQAKMRSRLKRDGIRNDLVDAALGKAVRVGLIDDLRWGEMRASALMRKGMGRVGIMRELAQNDIDACKIDGWPEVFEERFGTEMNRALAVLEKKPPRSKNLRASAYGMLSRKGYSREIAAHASALWLDVCEGRRLR